MNRLWLWLIPVAVSALMAACVPLGEFPLARKSTSDPLEVYRQSLQAWAQPQLEAIGALPRYHIQAELGSSGDRLEGKITVAVPNTSSTPWSDLVFRLYPNTPHYGGVMVVSHVQVNEGPVSTELGSESTALRLLLPTPLVPGEEALVTMLFTVELPRRIEGYTLFGWEDDILSLPGFFPNLAVRYEATGSNTVHWATEVPPRFADVLFNPVALYEVELTVPTGVTVVASGSTVRTTPAQEGMDTWYIAGGPLRDMTVVASDRWESASDMAAGATVTSYYLAGADAAGQATLFHAAAALRLYSDLFGRYPYAEFDVVATPLGVQGMEYSGLVTIGQDLYDLYREQLAFLVAHETAHQWWYAQVGNDPLAHPWLDEGPAEYAAFEYYRGVYGQAVAEDLLSARWRTPYAVAAANGIDGPVDQAASAMTTANYETLAYAKAALFFDALRDQVGDEMYTRVMRTFVETYRWQIVTPQHFLGLAQSVSGANLNPLAVEWLN